MRGQVCLDRGLGAEGAEEGRDAHQQQRRRHGLDFGQQAARAMGAGVRQHLEGHQRIAVDRFGEQVGVHLVFVGAKGFEQCGGLGENRDLFGQEASGPGRQRRQGLGQPSGVGCGGLGHRPRVIDPARPDLRNGAPARNARRGSRSEPRDAGQARDQFAIDVERAFRSACFGVELERGEARQGWRGPMRRAPPRGERDGPARRSLRAAAPR